MRTYVITPAAGKRLIARALMRHPAVQTALQKGTVVIVAGTTNGYVAEELLRSIGQESGFSRARFFRGLTVPPGKSAAFDPATFPGDVILIRGRRVDGKTLMDVVDDLGEGDVIVKGANALDLRTRRAAVLIGDTRGGTAAATMQAVVGRRVRLIVPVGLEKRVATDPWELATRLDAPGSTGPRLLPVVGEVVTELEAIALLTGASAELIAGGGVGGAEGSVWLGVEGTEEQVAAADALLGELLAEPPFTV